MRLVDSILMELEQEAKTTRRLLERVPEEKLGWKPRYTELREIVEHAWRFASKGQS